METIYYNGKEQQVTDKVYDEWVNWFYENADFGPADGDVREYMLSQFLEETGYTLESEDE
jgi:hypothetical protein